jgi:hypothetical protein
MSAMARTKGEADTGTPPDLPLLPRGPLVFTDLPAAALVLEALAPAIGSGLFHARGSFGAAVILVRDGALFETHLFSRSGAHSRVRDVDEMRSWPDALVSADRLDAGLVNLCAALLRGKALYDDLRLEWTSWPALLADLARRDAAYVVELTTPSGRGVTCVATGRQLFSYTDIHPSLGDHALLEAMAAGGDGEVRVRRVALSTFASEVASGVGAEILQAEPGRGGPRPAAVTDPRPSAAPSLATFAQAAATPHLQPPAVEQGAAGGAGTPTLNPTIEALLPDLSWVAPWETTWRRERGEEQAPASAPPATQPAAPPTQPVAPASVAAPSRHLTMADVHDELRAIARRRLQRSASRVESALDAAVAQQLPVDRVLDDLRSLSIRGVMPETIGAMVDEMAAASGRLAG